MPNTRCWLRNLVMFLALLACTVKHARAQRVAGATMPTVPTSPLWGDLSPGQHLVGFRTLFQFDASRTWKRTRDFTGSFSADVHGRPIQINVWYPATRLVSGERMTFGAYANQSAPPSFSALGDIMRMRSRESTEGAVSATQLPALLSTPMAAYRNAPPAPGRFPLVIYIGGLNAEINGNVVLAEYLASNGYVVASISLLGPTDEATLGSREPAGVATVQRDAEFAYGIMSASAYVDAARLAVIGHSVGAVQAASVALAHGNVVAVIGLDGTYGFKGSTDVLTKAVGYAPAHMRAAFLDLRRAQGEQDAELDLSPLLSFRHSERRLITLAHMHHSDFTSFAMVASRFATPTRPVYANTGWNRETGRRGHEQMSRIVLAFLDETVQRRADGARAFQTAVQQAAGSTATIIPGQPAPPSPSELVRLLHSGGLDLAKEQFARSCADRPVGECVDAGLLNSYGYELLGGKHGEDAVAVFQIVAWAHATSTNAYDSLADAYLAIGNREEARRAIRQAIAAAPVDGSLDAAARASFVIEQQRRLNGIQ